MPFIIQCINRGHSTSTGSIISTKKNINLCKICLLARLSFCNLYGFFFHTMNSRNTILLYTEKQKQNKQVLSFITSRKHAYIILTSETPRSYSKTGAYRGGIHYFSYFCSKHNLRVLVRTASSRRF